MYKISIIYGIGVIISSIILWLIRGRRWKSIDDDEQFTINLFTWLSWLGVIIVMFVFLQTWHEDYKFEKERKNKSDTNE